MHEFRILGPVEVLVDGRRVALPGVRQRELLAILLLHAGEVVSAERLIDELWGERPPERAANTLRATVSRLRKLLHTQNGDQLLLTRPDGYVLQIEPKQLDLRRFETLVAEGREALSAGDADRSSAILREALALWRGHALGDLDFGSLGRTEVVRLQEARMGALEQRIEADLQRGQHAALVGELEALTAQHPYRETLRRQLMLALYRSGRQAEALDVYQATRRLLADELGLEPGAELRRLQAAILRQDPALLPLSAAAPVTRPQERAPTLPRRHRVVLAAGGLLLVGAIVVVALLTGRGGRGLSAIPARSIGRIDAGTNRLDATVPIGQRPAAITVGHGSVWVANTRDGTVVRIDPRTSRSVRTLAVEGHPTGLAVDRRSVWVRNGVDHAIVRIDPGYDTVGGPIVVGPEQLPAPIFVPGIAAGRGSVWTAAPPAAVVHIDERAQRITGRIYLARAALGPIAYGAGRLWVAGASALSEIQVETGRAIASIRLGDNPTALVADPRGAVWIASGNDVQEIDGRGHTIVGTVELPSQVTALALGEGSVWAGSGSAVFRIDTTERRVTATIRVGRTPTALAVGRGAVWVGVD